MPPAAPPEPDAVRASHCDNVLLIELAEASGFPRLTRAVLRRLHHLLEDEPARGIVIAGTEKCFAAGAELAEVAALTPLEALQFSALGQGLMRRIETHRKPVVAAIRGYCLGGGFDLALACHLRVATADAVFGHPGAGLGILTGWGGTQRLPGALRSGCRAQALEMLVAGQTIAAGEAFAAGLLNRLVEPEQLLPTALALARLA